ncbi:MAG TPA: DNA primase [Byssovorax sp.]
MIKPETIALVKERTDIVALVAESVRLTRRGRSFTGLCPFHKEKTPSFHVNPERGFFHCFGCSESGSAIDFVIKAEGLTFPEAVKRLGERAGVRVDEDDRTDAEKREAAAARRAKDDLYGVNALAATFYEQALFGGPGGVTAHPLAHHAMAELARRGLVPSAAPRIEGAPSDAIADALQAFRVGYAPFGWDALGAFLKQQSISPVTAERAGLLSARSNGTKHYDRFRHQLMFAVTDVLGRVVAFSGRALDEPTQDELAQHRITGPSPSEDGRAPAKYINSPESPIYTKGEQLFGLHQARNAVRQQGEAVLVEGNFDVVSLHARGVGNVVAPLGTAFTPAQAKLLKRFAPSVIVLFDGDAAGRKATRASRGPSREGGLSVKVASLPAGTDPDELVRTQGPEVLLRLFKGARPIDEYEVDAALDRSAFATVPIAERVARIRAVREIIVAERDPTARQLLQGYADAAVQQLLVGGRQVGLREAEAILEQELRPVAEPRRELPVTHERARSRSREAEIPLEMLGALLDFSELLDDTDVDDALSTLDGDAALAVLALRRAARGPKLAAHASADSGEEIRESQAQKRVYADEFLAQIAPSIHSFAVGRLAVPRFEAADDAKLELLENARKLKRLSLSRENAEGVDQLHRVEAQGDVASENAILLEIMRRAQKKHGLA